MQKNSPDVAFRLEQELRRGVLMLAVLSQLRKDQYGYSLRQLLDAKGMAIEEGTLYPLLRRMEEQGLLHSEWKIEDGPPRRYYRRSRDGEKIYRGLATQWRGLVATVEGLMEESK
ncbi:MAG: helix-turn-helix transcriptional regulator [Proteobacteria bacterium]|nr:helix-turn-helix transcriptional regulator [Pseudomonadota bacterium]